MVRAPITRAGDVEVLLYAVAVDQTQRYVERAESPAEEHAAVIGNACEPIGHEILEGQADLAGEHQVRHLELSELQPYTTVEQVVITEPRILDNNLRVRALLREDHVEVITDVVAERRTGQQLEEIGRLEVQARVGSHFTTDRIDGFRVARLDEGLGAGGQRERPGKCQRIVTGGNGVIPPVRHAVVHVAGKTIAEVVEARVRRMTNIAAHAVFPRKCGHCVCSVAEHEKTRDKN